MQRVFPYSTMKKKIKLGHNDYFQQQFQKIEFAVSFFKEYLPKEIVRQMDFKTLRLAPGNFVGKALRNRRSDVLYDVQIGGKKALFYIHLEHQRSPDKKMAFRMLIYTVRIWEQFELQYPRKSLPLIYPMVVYQGKKRWTSPLTVHDFIDVPEFLKPYCPQMTYDLMDLSSLKDEDIQGELFQQLVLLIMRSIDSPDINELLFEKYFPFIKEVLKQKRGIEYIEDMLYYLSYKSKYLDREKIVEQLSRDPETKNVREVAMTLAEQWKQEGISIGIEKGIEKGMEKGIEKGMEKGIEEGMEKGIEEGIEEGMEKGIEEGIKEGKTTLVYKQLFIKFKDEAEGWTERLSWLSSEELEIVAERILTAGTLEEVFSGFVE